MYPSRRDLLKALAGAPLRFALQRPAAATTVNGVVFGGETFRFRDLPPAGDPQLILTIVRGSSGAARSPCSIIVISVAASI